MSKGNVVPESPEESKGHPFSFSRAFNTAAQWTSQQCGRASTFAFACLVVVAWAVTGPMFNYSDTWQLVINSGTTIVTFLMVEQLDLARQAAADAGGCHQQHRSRFQTRGPPDT
jgi:uncharacterized membrane protein YkvI